MCQTDDYNDDIIIVTGRALLSKAILLETSSSHTHAFALGVNSLVF